MPGTEPTLALDRQPGYGVNRNERNRVIVQLRSRGMTLHRIGARFGISATRVGQILVEVGGPAPDDVATARDRSVARDRAETTARVVAFARTHPAATLAQISRSCTATHEDVLAALPERERRRRQAPAATTVSPVMYARPVGEVAAEHGLAALSARQYDRLRHHGHPSSARIRQVLGSWSAACAQAGIGPAGHSSNTAADTDEAAAQACCWVDAYLDSGSPTYTYRDFETWLRTRQDAPSAQTVRNRTAMNWSELLSDGNRRAAKGAAG